MDEQSASDPAPEDLGDPVGRADAGLAAAMMLSAGGSYNGPVAPSQLLSCGARGKPPQAWSIDDMITLYHAPQSRSTRMLWLLEELGEAYSIHPVSISRPMSGDGAPDPANPHPDKRVPAIDHDGILVAESLAIVLYLTEAFPGAQLGPVVGDSLRGAYLTWLAWYAAEFEPALFAGLGGELNSAPHKMRSYTVAMKRLETALAHGPFMLGERFSAVDFLISSALAFGRKVFPDDPALDAYIQRCHSRPAAVRGLALDNASGIQRAA